MSVVILGIESSCDETAAAVSIDDKVMSNIIATQAVHAQYGGVVPELASRAHMQHIVPVVDAAIKRAGVQLSDLDAVAFTKAPGLIGSLLVGSQFAKSLALALDLPLIGVHHMQAHVIANLIDDPRPSFPFLCLTVSGGHTQILICESPEKLRVIGQTIDDAAGEAFDKTAKILGLPYPGGPLIDQYAQSGDGKRFSFPEPQIPALDFSFSGLKTSILYFIRNEEQRDKDFLKKNLHDVCASVQARIISILLNKVHKAAAQTGIRNICLAGGVSANKGLRAALAEMGIRNKWNTFIPAFQYCTDNAAMIAMTGYYAFKAGRHDGLDVPVSARAEW